MQRDELPAAESGLGGDADEFGVLDVLAGTRLDLALGQSRSRRVAVSAGSE